MKLCTFRQQVCLTFFMASAMTALIGDYVWAYHFAPYDPKFPTSLSVFQLSVTISAVTVCITTALFALPLVATRITDQSPTASDHTMVIFFAGIVQFAIFVSPHLTDQFNPVLIILFTAPILASFTFLAIRHQSDRRKQNASSEVP